MTTAPSPTETIYIRLLDEGTDVWRPTQGRKIGPMTFEVLPTPNYSAEDQKWEFAPGSIVKGQITRLEGNAALVAVRPGERIPPLPSMRSNLRLLDLPAIAAIRVALEPRGYESVVCIAEWTATGVRVDQRQLLRDLTIVAQGEELPSHLRTDPVQRLWWTAEPSIDVASSLKHLVSHDLAYDDRVLGDDVASEVVESFLGLFESGVKVFQNGRVAPDRRSSSFAPITEATCESGFGFVDSHRVGLFVVTGED